MIQRCYNPKCKDYPTFGGRGVTICDDWLYRFSSFFKWAIDNGYNDKMTIARLDCSGEYCPENCKWVDIKEAQQ